ncbi:hypothetical protein A0H81_04755 [Grifola frondosa]|uniref:Uncharacterized protein n=1 Tax=Grifola frondosa TaxID=5627 RepID=A0A1C7MH02_GRIFR|nr:hypothetical protein A0H81_04755 [Grifola frondosa]
MLTSLSSCVFGADIVKCEEAVYTRLEDLQGGIIPQSYGFYLFTLRVDVKIYDHLMEHVAGPTPAQSGVAQMSEEKQVKLIHRVQEAARAIKLAGVHKADAMIIGRHMP